MSNSTWYTCFVLSMHLPPAQNFVFMNDVLAGAKRYVCASEMFASLSRHIYPTDISKGMIQASPIRFVSALYGTATGRNFTVLRWDPLHIGSDRQEIVSPFVFEFGAGVWDATWGVNGRSDLARMNRVVEDRGTYEDWAHAICVFTSGRSDLIGWRELGIRS